MADDKKDLDIVVPKSLQEIPSEESEAAPLDAKTQALLDEEIELESKYGDSAGRTFAESVASGATFGLSDQALVKSGIATEEELRERRQRNEAAALTGELAGIIAPTLLSGGTSLGAKVAQKAGAGVLGAAKTGVAVEQLTAKGLQKLARSTGNEKLAKSVLAKATEKISGSAVEGAFYGAGQLIKEDALGEAEFNAENLLANVGTGAALSGAAGGIFGTAQALVPVISKKTGNIKDYVAKKVKTGTDINKAAADLSGISTTKLTKLKERRPEIYENLGAYYKNILNLKATDSIESLYNKNQKAISKIGEQIDKTLTIVDSAVDSSQLPSRMDLYKKIGAQYSDLLEDFAGLPSAAAKRNANKIYKELENWELWARKGGKNLTAKDVQKLKIKLQKLAKWERTFDKVNLDEKLARRASQAVRQIMLDIADSVFTYDQNLGSILRKLNLDYGTAMELSNNLSKKVDKKSANKSLIGLKDLLLGDIFIGADKSLIGAGAIAGKKFAESDLRRKLTILSSIEKSNKKVDNQLTKSVKNFLSSSKFRMLKPTSTNILLNTAFKNPTSDTKNRKKAKNKKEAFNNLREDLNSLKTNPLALNEYLLKNSLRLTNAAPETAAVVDITLVKAIDFLSSKMPTPNHQQGMFQTLRLSKTYEPSSIQVAKMERYLEAVENPLSVIKDLENGMISREGIEAVKFVYPNLFQRLQEKILTEIQENPEKAEEIPYNKRLQIGSVLEIPTDTSLIPENIAALQQLITSKDQPSPGDDQLRAKGLDNLNLANKKMSGTEQVISRE